MNTLHSMVLFSISNPVSWTGTFSKLAMSSAHDSVLPAHLGLAAKSPRKLHTETYSFDFRYYHKTFTMSDHKSWCTSQQPKTSCIVRTKLGMLSFTAAECSHFCYQMNKRRFVSLHRNGDKSMLSHLTLPVRLLMDTRLICIGTSVAASECPSSPGALRLARSRRCTISAARHTRVSLNET